MKTRTVSMIAGTIVLLLLAAGVAGAHPNRSLLFASRASADSASTVTSSISYQGSLSNPGGGPVNGERTMRFVIYDDAAAGAALWDSGDILVSVDGGLFTVQLAVDPTLFNGQALWLDITVAGETLTPRQEFLPAPYALSLRPGADIMANGLAATDAALTGYAPATGTALRAVANNGPGLYGASENTYGVWGASTNGWAGYFRSQNGYGLRVTTTGSAHWDHGAYVNANSGYGIYAKSTKNTGVRGEGGDTTDIVQPSGRIGVVGIGPQGGVAGASGYSVGVTGYSTDGYGGRFSSDNATGIYASGGPYAYAASFRNPLGYEYPGIYVDGTIVATGSKLGYVVDISRNAGADELELGDVVAVVGVDEPVVGEIPVMRVVKAGADNAGAVVGVVDARFLVDQDTEGAQLVRPDGVAAVSAAGTGIQSGEYVSVVTLGAFKQIKVDAGYGAIEPGDLLTPSPNAGYAMVATDAPAGTIVGKALEGFESGQGTIAVYVTIQ